MDSKEVTPGPELSKRFTRVCGNRIGGFGIYGPRIMCYDGFDSTLPC